MASDTPIGPSSKRFARRMGRAEPAAPSWEQLQQEDLAAERERIKALEDAIYGPQVE